MNQELKAQSRHTGRMDFREQGFKSLQGFRKVSHLHVAKGGVQTVCQHVVRHMQVPEMGFGFTEKRQGTGICPPGHVPHAQTGDGLRLDQWIMVGPAQLERRKE